MNIPHLLTTFAAPKALPSIHDYLEEKDKRMDMVLLDSGAFSVWTKGLKVDVNKYIDYCLRLKCPRIDWICPIVLDVIPGSPNTTQITAEMVTETAKEGWKNYMLMLESGLTPMPVFHQGEAFEWLDMMVESTDFIGIGGIAMTLSQQRLLWLDTVFNYIEKHGYGKNTKFHGLGVASLTLMKSYPWWSCDSAAAVIVAGKTCEVIIPVLKDDGTFDFTHRMLLDCGDSKRRGDKKRVYAKVEEPGGRDGFFDRGVDLTIAPDSHKDSLSTDTRGVIDCYLQYVSKKYGTKFTFEDLAKGDSRTALNIIFFREFEHQWEYDPAARSVQLASTQGFFDGVEVKCED
jgi:hypothetical protein